MCSVVWVRLHDHSKGPTGVADDAAEATHFLVNLDSCTPCPKASAAITSIGVDLTTLQVHSDFSSKARGDKLVASCRSLVLKEVKPFLGQVRCFIYKYVLLLNNNSNET